MIKKNVPLVMAGLLFLSAQSVNGQTYDVSGMADVTEQIVNAGFDNDYEGWTIEVPGKKISTGEKANGLIAGTQKHLQLWVGSGGMQGRIFQTIKNLPAGEYVLQAAFSPTFTGSVKLYAGEETTEVVSNDPRVYDVAISFLGGDLEIGVDIDATGQVLIDMDEFHLFYKSLGQEDGELQILQQQFDRAMQNLMDYGDKNLSDYSGLSDEFFGVYDEFDQINREDKEVLASAIDSLKTIIPTFQTALDNLTAYVSLKAQADKMLQRNTHYPGYDTFNAFVTEENLFDVFNAVRADIASHRQNLADAILTYNLSQNASENTPADYTFLVQYPNFCSLEAEPTIGEDGSWSYPNADNYTIGQAPADAKSTGWTIGNGGGDQRLNWSQGRICWNAWNSNFSSLSIQQSLKDLPNGLYTVSADLISPSACIAGQQVYAKSSLTEVVSPGLSGAVWNDDTSLSIWETLTTEKILVDDHTLTIGAKSTHPSDAADGAAGWFLVSNFKLNYYGESTGTIVKEMYEKSLSQAKDQTTKLQLKGDVAALQALIDSAEGLMTEDDMKQAIAKLDSATLAAQTLQTKTQKVLDGTYQNLKNDVATVYTGDMQAVAEQALANFEAFLASETATYAVLAEQEKSVASMRSNYLPTLQAALKEKFTLAAVKEALSECVEIQKTLLWEGTELVAAERINKMTDDLKLAVRKCRAAQYMNDGTTDYTGLIENPQIAGNVHGWTVNRPTGNQDMSSGKDYDGVKSGYLNSWNPNLGGLRYTASQTLRNIPNGTYRLKAMFRVMNVTPGAEGVYMYTIVDGDTASAQFKAVHQETVNFTKYVSADMTAADGSDSIQVVSDKYGSVWQDAMDRTNLGADVVPGSLDEAILEAGSGWGCGWQWKEMDVEVHNHTLTLGVTCDSVLTNGRIDTDGQPCVPFSGTQFSADEFSLTQLSVGDNTGWTPLTDMANAIEQIPAGAENVVGERIYTLDGIEVSAADMQKNRVYIVRDAKTVRKIFIK